jgi:protein-S-isoprenylcysteine O-methyltransferase Ste14
MSNIFKKHNGMGIVGQGGKIILFTLPSLAAAILADIYAHSIAALPESVSFLRLVGYVWLIPGLVYWATAVIQLLVGFSRGRLVTSGAYRIARNPIYSSAIFFLLPAVSLITLTWVYFMVSAFLYTGVMIFISAEERQLTQAFGKAYVDYRSSVDRLIPFKKPAVRTTPRAQALQG